MAFAEDGLPHGQFPSCYKQEHTLGIQQIDEMSVRMAVKEIPACVSNAVMVTKARGL